MLIFHIFLMPLIFVYRSRMEYSVEIVGALLLCAYSGVLILAIRTALNVGSQTYSVSIIHRWSGILTLILPILLSAYETIYQIHPNVYVYLFTVITIAFNCIFGALLIPKRTPKWDTPTIRAFVKFIFDICLNSLQYSLISHFWMKQMKIVAALLGFSWVSLSFIIRFGHISSFEVFCRFLALLNIICLVYALCDCAHHIQQFRINMKTGTAMNLGHRFRSKRPTDVGLKFEVPSLWYCFGPAFYQRQNSRDRAKVAAVTLSPSNLSLLVVQIWIVLAGLIGHGFPVLPLYHLICGHQGLVYHQKTFPNIMRYSVYGILLGALVNNLAGFAATLVT